MYVCFLCMNNYHQSEMVVVGSLLLVVLGAASQAAGTLNVSAVSSRTYLIPTWLPSLLGSEPGPAPRVQQDNVDLKVSFELFDMEPGSKGRTFIRNLLLHAGCTGPARKKREAVQVSHMKNSHSAALLEYTLFQSLSLQRPPCSRGAHSHARRRRARRSATPAAPRPRSATNRSARAAARP